MPTQQLESVTRPNAPNQLSGVHQTLEVLQAAFIGHERSRHLQHAPEEIRSDNLPTLNFVIA